MNKVIRPGLVYLILIFTFAKAFSCTTASYTDNLGKVWVIKSYDYHIGSGAMFVNKRGIKKTSFDIVDSNPVEWTSKYGSVSFNQVARDFPFGGMNETGLNIEIMWLSNTLYPTLSSSKKNINESQIIQYVLDNAATTKEAIELIQRVNLSPILATVHYMICDINNKCSTVEYLNHKLVVTDMKSDKQRFLQNAAYEESLKYRKKGPGIIVRQSSEQIKRIFNNSNIINEEAFVEKSFRNLTDFEQHRFTRWQIVYNLTDQKVWFKTIKNPTIKYFNLGSYELSCKIDHKDKMISLNNQLSGDIKTYLNYFSKKRNASLLKDFIAD